MRLNRSILVVAVAMLIAATAADASHVPADAVVKDVVTKDSRVTQHSAVWYRRCDGRAVRVAFSYPLFRRISNAARINRRVEAALPWDLISDCTRKTTRKNVGDEIGQECEVTMLTTNVVSLKCRYWAAVGFQSAGNTQLSTYALATGAPLTIGEVFADLGGLRRHLTDAVMRQYPDVYSTAAEATETAELLTKSFAFTPSGVTFTALQGRQPYEVSLSYDEISDLLFAQFR